jgi:hypothetical protein
VYSVRFGGSHGGQYEHYCLWDGSDQGTDTSIFRVESNLRGKTNRIMGSCGS